MPRQSKSGHPWACFPASNRRGWMPVSPTPCGFVIGAVYSRDERPHAHDTGTALELPGYKDIRTTIIYTHLLNRGGRGLRSPAHGLNSATR